MICSQIELLAIIRSVRLLEAQSPNCEKRRIMSTLKRSMRIRDKIFKAIDVS